MTNSHTIPTAIIGHGVAGPLLALLLHSTNRYTPTVYEKVPAFQDVGGSLCIAPNGLRVLHSVGLAHKVVEAGAPIDRFVHRREDGEVLFDCQGMVKKELEQRGMEWPSVGIKRSVLLRILAEEVRKKGIEVVMGKALVGIQDPQNNESVVLTFADGTTTTTSLVMACDGLHSPTRTLLFGKSHPTYTTLTQTIGISPRPPGLLTTSNPMLNIYGPSTHFITYPISPTHMCWALTQREDVEAREEWVSQHTSHADTITAVMRPQNWTDTDALSLTSSPERLLKVGLYDRPPLTTWYTHRVVLIGDAAHPTSPHLGQGANQAMEDCAVL
ncbi:hypothetical protein HK104_010275, partial [Borealophlyctis nickersoniae]